MEVASPRNTSRAPCTEHRVGGEVAAQPCRPMGVEAGLDSTKGQLQAAEEDRRLVALSSVVEPTSAKSETIQTAT